MVDAFCTTLIFPRCFFHSNSILSSEVPPTPRQPTATQHHYSNGVYNSTSSSAAAAAAHSSSSSNVPPPPINPTDSRWISSLRRRDPEIQPTLPSINVGFTIPAGSHDKRGRSSKITSGIRKSRSVERFRARKVRGLNYVFFLNPFFFLSFLS